MQRETPRGIDALRAISFDSDAQAVNYIKSKLRYPIATWALRVGFGVVLASLVVCWVFPEAGGRIALSTQGGGDSEDVTISTSILFGSAAVFAGFFIILFGYMLRRRRRREIMETLRGTRYVQFVSGVVKRRY